MQNSLFDAVPIVGTYGPEMKGSAIKTREFLVKNGDKQLRLETVVSNFFGRIGWLFGLCHRLVVCEEHGTRKDVFVIARSSRDLLRNANMMNQSFGLGKTVALYLAALCKANLENKKMTETCSFLFNSFDSTRCRTLWLDIKKTQKEVSHISYDDEIRFLQEQFSDLQAQFEAAKTATNVQEMQNRIDAATQREETFLQEFKQVLSVITPEVSKFSSLLEENQNLLSQAKLGYEKLRTVYRRSVYSAIMDYQRHPDQWSISPVPLYRELRDLMFALSDLRKKGEMPGKKEMEALEKDNSDLKKLLDQVDPMVAKVNKFFQDHPNEKQPPIQTN